MKLSYLFALIIQFNTAYIEAKCDESCTEHCNEWQDAAIPEIQATFNKYTFIEMKVPPPCTECKVENLGTIFKAGETTLEKNHPCNDDYLHHMLVGFKDIKSKCQCKLKLGSKVLEGEIHTIWPNPQLHIDLVLNRYRNHAYSLKTDIVGNMKDLKISCAGTENWKKVCETGVLNQVFHKSIKAEVKAWFPHYSSNKKKN